MTIIFLIFALLFSVNAEAATFYVAKNGSNSNTCIGSPTTSGSAQNPNYPKLNIDNGIACMSGGDRLEIKAGNYHENFTQSGIPAGTAPNPTTITRFANDTVTLFATNNMAVYSPSENYIVFDGLTFDGQNTAGYVGLTIAYGNHITVQNSIFRNNNKHLLIDATSNNVTVRNNLMQCSHSHAVYVGAANNLFEGNTVERSGTRVHVNSDALSLSCEPHVFDPTLTSAGCGFHVYDTGNPNVHDNIIRNNTVRDTLGECGGILVSHGANQVYNNVVYNSSGNGIVVYESADGNIVYNNTVYNSGTYSGSGNGITVASPTASNTIVKNNIIVGSPSGNFSDNGSGTVFSNNLCFGTGGTCPSAINQDPRFVNASANNFNLCTGSNQPVGGSPTCVVSPAINQGTATITGSISIPPCPTNIPYCFNSSAPDMGAFESGAVAPPTVNITLPVSNTSTIAAVTIQGTSTGANNITWDCGVRLCGGGSTISTANWTTASTITLKSGINIITVTATGAGGTATATKTITYTPSFPGAALVAAYGFETGSGTTAFDVTSNGLNATFVNAPTWTTAGKYGNALSFNGTSDYLSVPDDNKLDFTQSFTLSAWVFPITANLDWRAIVVKNYVQYLYASTAGACTDGALFAGIATNGALGPSYYVCQPTPPLPVNTWTHVAVTYDGTNLRLYRDGALIQTTPATDLMEPSTGNLTIAASIQGSALEFFQGVLDEVRIYNIAIVASNATNSTFGAPCGYTSQADRTNMALVSVMGDANCPVVAGSPPLTFKIPASATGLKVGANATFKLGQP